MSAPKRAATIKLASESDARWFEQHPNRAHRLRPAFRGEMRGDGWIAIRQIQPGLRIRAQFWPVGVPPLDEATAHSVFDLVIECKGTGRFVPPAEIRRRADMLDRGGRA